MHIYIYIYILGKRLLFLDVAQLLLLVQLFYQEWDILMFQFMKEMSSSEALTHLNCRLIACPMMSLILKWI